MSAKVSLKPSQVSAKPSLRQPERYAWKILRPPLCDNSIGRSLVSYLPYSPRRWNYPPVDCGPLCAFETVADCFSLGLYPDDRLYLCAITPSTQEHIWWHDGEQTPYRALPFGTLLCSRIRCLARVRFEANLYKERYEKEPYRAISIAKAESRAYENYYHLRLETES